jgi:hypothetical protein
MSDSDSDDILQCNIVERRRRQRIFRPRINFSIIDFSIRFRLNTITIEKILNEIGIKLQHDSDRNQALSPEKQLLLAIRYLATGGHMQLVGDAHGLSKAYATSMRLVSN